MVLLIKKRIFSKIKKDLVSNIHINQALFYIFINNSRSEQNKKHPEHPFVDIGKLKTCARFQLKILSSLVVEARQSFIFSDK